MAGSPQKVSKHRWDVTLYERRHSFVWKYGADLIELLSPKKGERILDLGCGTGHLTYQITASGAEVIGIDSDVAMIAQARENYPDLQFEVADGVHFDFAEPFDAVFSNASLHWIKEAGRVVACIWRALKPGGRFVAEFGGRGNVKAIVGAIYNAIEALGYPSKREFNPWYLPSVGEYATLLERQGFGVNYAAFFDRPTPLEGGDGGIHNWIDMFAGDFLIGIPVGKRTDVIQSVENQLRPNLYRDGTWFADYRRIRVFAVKELEQPARIK